MECPFCGSHEHKVVDKRDTPDGKATRRRRECLKCQKRFTTYERVEDIDIIVIKKDGSRSPFDRAKVLEGIKHSCHKRPVSYDQMKQMVDKIESSCRKLESSEVSYRQIGAFVMRELKKADKVAYIRFASVYKEFTDVEEFEEEIKKLIRK